MGSFSAVNLIYNWSFWIFHKVLWYLGPCFIWKILTWWPPSSISNLSIRDIIIKILIMFMHRSRHYPLNLIQLSLLLNHPRSLRISHIVVVIHLLLLLMLLWTVVILWIMRIMLLLMLIWAEWAIGESPTILMPLFDHLFARHYRILVLN